MEADLSRYHHLDLVDLWRRKLTYRQVLVRIRHLPDDSATATAVRGAPAWSSELELLDLIRIHLATLTRQKKIGPHPLSPYAELLDESPELEESRRKAMARAAEREARQSRPT